MRLATLAMTVLFFLGTPIAHAQTLSVTGDCPEVTVATTGLSPGADVLWVSGNRPGSATLSRGPCAGTPTGLDRTRFLALANADASGRWAASQTVADNRCGRPSQVIDLSSCTLSPVRRLPAACLADEDCDDGNPCTLDRCRVGACFSDGTGVLAACDDGDACTTADTCAGDPAGSCTAGSALSCDDGIACTVDTCDPATGCAASPDDGVCDDGWYCNGEEICDIEADCLSGFSADCDDFISCTLDICNEDEDRCDHLPDDAACDDGDPSAVELCDLELGCVSIAAESCNGADDDLNGMVDDGIACPYTLLSYDYWDPSIAVAPCANDDISIWLDGVLVHEDDSHDFSCLAGDLATFDAMPGQRITAEAYDLGSGANVYELWLRREADGAELLLLEGTGGDVATAVLWPEPFWTGEAEIPEAW